MDNRKWHYDLSRRYDGSFGILGGSGYDKEQWGVAYPLAYTFPRKTLRITGAPRTKFSKPMKTGSLRNPFQRVRLMYMALTYG